FSLFSRPACGAGRRGGGGRGASRGAGGLGGGGRPRGGGGRRGLPPARHRDEPVALEDAQQIRQVLVALSRLAASHERPFILALDQVDNLDGDQFSALTRFLEALLDTACNLLVVTTGIQSTLKDWRERRVVQSSAWDRIAQFDVLLLRLPSAHAELLVRQRLDGFLTPFAGLEAIARLRQADPLFPLGNRWADEHLRQHIH